MKKSPQQFPKDSMRAKRGFTLIEIIMAIVLLGIISVILGLFVAQQVQAVARADDYTLAFNLARAEIEIVNNLSYANITDLTTPDYAGYTGYTMYRTVTFVFGGPVGESLKQAVVQIRRTGGMENLATLTTYIANNVSFGL